jgi:uncharacterized protein YbjT (DUF2867 family)
MRIVVFGGTGRIGGHVALRALARGHQVVAVSRRTGRQTIVHDDLTTVEADVLEPETLGKPLAGADAVVFAVGLPGRGPTIVRSAGISAVGKAMREAGVSRLVAVTPSAAVISPRAPLARKIALRYFLHKICRNPFLDVERLELELPHTGLDWSVVRGPRLLDRPASGRFAVVPEGQVRRLRPVGIADFADYVVTHVEDDGARHDIVTVTGAAARVPVPATSAVRNS